MGKKAQALLELALFAGIMLMVLLTALNYQRNMHEQKDSDAFIFKRARDLAKSNTYIEKDIDGEDVKCSGAVVSYSWMADRQAERLFQGGQRRTTASSASVYDSNSENPEVLEFNNYNAIDIGPSALPRVIRVPRDGTEDPVEGSKLSLIEKISIAYPMLAGAAGGLFNLKSHDWYKSWGGWLDLGLRTAAFVVLAVGLSNTSSAMQASEDERARLKAKDEQMGGEGWRVTDIVHDGAADAGRWYVKKVTSQVWNIETGETKNIDYDEIQKQEANKDLKITRDVVVVHVATRKIQRRYDLTVPPDDPNAASLPLALHTFEMLPDKTLSIDLSGDQHETWN